METAIRTLHPLQTNLDTVPSVTDLYSPSTPRTWIKGNRSISKKRLRKLLRQELKVVRNDIFVAYLCNALITIGLAIIAIIKFGKWFQ